MAHRHYNSAIVLFLQIAILVSSSSAHPSDGLSLISLGDQLQQLAQDFASYKVNMREVFAAKDAQLGELKLKVERQQEKIVALEQQIDERRHADDSKENKISDLTHPMAAAAAMPKSCADLRFLGHSANGLYLIMGTEMVETVFCDFSVPLPSDPSFQTWIGQVDVKSQPVYFYVQRNTSYSTLNTSIPFELAQLNIGNAMDLESGKFTAPRTGTYHFAYSGLARFSSSSSESYLKLGIFLNGNLIGSGQASEIGTVLQWDSLSLHSTVNLQVGDQIWLQIWSMSASGTILDDGYQYFTHFSGWLLDENISQSLV